MSLRPAFDIGIWNAWILTFILFLFMMPSGALPRDVGKRITPVKEVQKIGKFMMIVFFILILYSVFLPLKLRTMWFFTGLAVYVIGSALGRVFTSEASQGAA